MLIFNIQFSLPFLNLIIYLAAAKLKANLFQDSVENANFTLTLMKLINQLKTQQNFDTILIVNGSNTTTFTDSCLLFEGLKEHQLPRLLFSTQTLDDLKLTSHLSNVLIMSCHYLQYNNEFWFNKPFQLAPHIILADNSSEVVKICQNLIGYEINRAVVILSDFSYTNIYLSCKLVLGNGRQNTAEIVTHVLRENASIHTSTVGIEISTHPDQMQTRSYIYYNNKGEIKMDGYVGNIVQSFAERVKASLVFKYPIELGKVTFAEVVENRTLEGHLDVATSIRLVRNDMDNLSYPVEFMDYCYMIPLPRYIATSQLFFVIMDLSTLLFILLLINIYAVLITWATYGSTKFFTFTNVCLNDKSIRGILGQSYTVPSNPKFSLNHICLLIGCSSMLFATAYEAFLQSYWTEPPREQLVHSYEDLRRTGIRIVATARIKYYINPFVFEKYRDVFVLYDNYGEFMQQRDKMDSNFAYSLTTPLWQVYQEKQKFFKQPIFFYSSLCILNSSLMAIPVRPGWPYRRLFDLHLMQIRDNGLMQLWVSRTFYVMLRFGQTDLEDLSPARVPKKKITNDALFWVWMMYLTCISASIVAFFGELIAHRFLIKRN